MKQCPACGCKFPPMQHRAMSWVEAINAALQWSEDAGPPHFPIVSMELYPIWDDLIRSRPGIQEAVNKRLKGSHKEFEKTLTRIRLKICDEFDVPAAYVFGAST